MYCWISSCDQRLLESGGQDLGFIRADAAGLAALHFQLHRLQSRDIVEPAVGRQADAPAVDPGVAHRSAGVDLIEGEALADQADAKADAEVLGIDLDRQAGEQGQDYGKEYHYAA